MPLLRRILTGLAVIAVSLTSFGTSRATIHDITQSSLTFVPNTLTIEEGDTVRWNWTGGSHTVTNGTGSADPNVGTLFDAPLNSLNTTFQFVFNATGTYPYFCRPHEGFNMRGTITVDVASGVETPGASTALLRQSFPNPFQATTQIEYSIRSRGEVRLTVHDVQGRLVATIEEGARETGDYRAVWNGVSDSGRVVPAGVYFYRLEAGGQQFTRKLILMK